MYYRAGCQAAKELPEPIYFLNTVDAERLGSDDPRCPAADVAPASETDVFWQPIVPMLVELERTGPGTLGEEHLRTRVLLRLLDNPPTAADHAGIIEASREIRASTLSNHVRASLS